MFGGFPAYKMKRALINGKIETIQVAFYGKSLTALPNGNRVYGTANRKVFLLNENFQKIKKFSKGGHSCCAINDRNKIYHKFLNCHQVKNIVLFHLI